MTSLPLPGYQVQTTDANDAIDRENTFKVLHSRPDEDLLFSSRGCSEQEQVYETIS